MLNKTTSENAVKVAERIRRNIENYDFNVSFLNQELERVKKLGITKMVIHPGSHVGKGIEEGIKVIQKVLNNCIDNGVMIFNGINLQKTEQMRPYPWDSVCLKV